MTCYRQYLKLTIFTVISIPIAYIILLFFRCVFCMLFYDIRALILFSCVYVMLFCIEFRLFLSVMCSTVRRSLFSKSERPLIVVCNNNYRRSCSYDVSPGRVPNERARLSFVFFFPPLLPWEIFSSLCSLSPCMEVVLNVTKERRKNIYPHKVQRSLYSDEALKVIYDHNTFFRYFRQFITFQPFSLNT